MQGWKMGGEDGGRWEDLVFFGRVEDMSGCRE